MTNGQTFAVLAFILVICSFGLMFVANATHSWWLLGDAGVFGMGAIALGVLALRDP